MLRTRTVTLAFAFFALAACSSDSGNGAKDTGPQDMAAVDDAVDAQVGEAAVDGPQADTTSPDTTTVDAAFPCDPTILGTTCTQGGSECGAQACLLAGSEGFCSCKCRPDDITTDLADEDSCPANHSCGVVGSPAEDRCLEVLANTPQGKSCNSKSAISADPTDPPFLLAARLTPSSYPFTVYGVRYLLPMGSGCDNSLAHEVKVFVGSNTTPDASPAVGETIAVPAGTAEPKGRWLTHPLVAPIVLTSGQQLYVALLVTYDAQKQGSICPQVCGDPGNTGEKSFSNDTGSTLPYTWTSFKAKAWPGELTTAALGFGPQP
jgi:hypothetical protein